MMTRQKWTVAILGLAVTSTVVFVATAIFGIIFWSNTPVFDKLFPGCLAAVFAFLFAGLVVSAEVGDQ
jgi:hypothetical protein